MQIAVLTVYTKEYSDLAECTTPIMEEYCKRNGYKFYAIDITGTPVYYGYKKLEWVKFLFTSGQAEIVLAIDLDTLFTNFDLRVEDFVNARHDFFITKYINGINAGSFIVKKSDWSEAFLSSIISMQNDVSCEQDVIEKLIFLPENVNKVDVLSHPSINSYLYEEYGENYGKILGIQKQKPNKYEGQWEFGCFLLHLPGLPNKRRIEIFESKKQEIVK